MSKIRLSALVLAISTLVGITAVTSAAFGGTGVAVVASEVEVIKSGLLGKKLCFTDGDFKRAFAIDDFGSITVITLPSSTEGSLMLAGRRVREGQVIKRRNIAALVFVPADKSVREASFRFTLDGGEEHSCIMKFLDKINYAPTLAPGTESAISLSTQSDISVFGSFGASDPEGDELEYIIAAYPKSGRLETVSGGRYKYTPADGYTGYDSFTFAVRDEYGNYSEAREVVLKVTKRMSDVVYVDMTDAEEYNAAVAMSAMGVMSGKQLGDDMYFMPEESVSRAEFVAMAMKAAGLRPDVGASYFDDDADIPTSLRGYVAAAARRGVIDAEIKDGRLTFEPNRAITVYEAAGIMAGILGRGSAETSEYSELTDVPAWARGDVEAMVTLGVINGDKCNPTECVTRADAAEFLYNMVNNS